MKIGILGSGFGVYGYLPAVCKNLWTPIMLEKSKNKIDSRPELFQYRDRIIYADSEKNLVENSESLIIATTPKYQTEFLQSNVSININHFYLEKPISPTLEDHFKLIQFLKLNKKNFSVAYLFFYTSWYLNIKNLLRFNKCISLEFIWKVKKNESTWKNNIKFGGGLLYFYGIHFLASLKNLGVPEDNIVIIEDNNEIIISANDLQNNTIKIIICYGDKSHFIIKVPEKNSGKVFYEDQTPFGLQNRLGTIDTRVSFIAKYLKDMNLTSHTDSLGIEEYIFRVIKMNRKNTNLE